MCVWGGVFPLLKHTDISPEWYLPHGDEDKVTSRKSLVMLFLIITGFTHDFLGGKVLISTALCFFHI